MNNLSKGLTILALASVVATIALPVSAYEHRNWKGEHPRRNEVMARDHNMDRQIYRDRGQLNGNYKSLMSQDRAIKQQTKADFRANGGYLTKPQQRQINQEENGLKRDIHQDRQ
jgi:hypothetical protein